MTATKRKLPRGSEVFERALARIAEEHRGAATVRFEFRLLPETRATLEAVAERLGESMSSVLHRLIDREAARLLET